MASDALNKALGVTTGNDTKLAMALKKSTAGGDRDDMTLDEKAAVAEARFKAILDKIQARMGPDRYQSNVDFVEQNTSNIQKPINKHVTMQHKMQLLQDRTHVAKLKREFMQRE